MYFLMIFDGFCKNIKKNEFGSRFIDIGLENVAVAERAWWGDLRAAVIRGVKSIDVDKTPAKILISSASEKTDPDDAFTSL